MSRDAVHILFGLGETVPLVPRSLAMSESTKGLLGCAAVLVVALLLLGVLVNSLNRGVTLVAEVYVPMARSNTP